MTMGIRKGPAISNQGESWNFLKWDDISKKAIPAIMAGNEDQNPKLDFKNVDLKTKSR